MNSFKPHMKILSKAQKKIWPALGWTKTNGFVLQVWTPRIDRF